MKNVWLVFSLVVINLMSLIDYSNAAWTYVGDYVEPYQVDKNTITFTCTNAIVKIEVCTEDILRIR